MSAVNRYTVNQVTVYQCNEMEFTEAFSQLCPTEDPNLTDVQINDLISIAMLSMNILNQILQRINYTTISSTRDNINLEGETRQIGRDFFYETSVADSSGNIEITATTEWIFEVVVTQQNPPQSS